MSLPYTDKEICRSFAQNPCMQQVTILSELNNCHEIEIFKIVHSYGLSLPKKEKAIEEKPKETKESIKYVFAIEHIKKRRAKLEFMSLSFPERQKEWLDEMQELRMIIDGFEL